eukprot:g23059.t2
MSNLNDRIKVWIGKTAVVLPRLGGRFHAVVCDHAGKNFLPDLLFLQHQHLLPRAVVLANHVLKPGAPEFLWEVTRHPTTQVVSVPEFEQPPLEDWMSVTVLTRPLQNDPPAGVLDLVELSAGILDRASDTRSRGRQLGSVDDWKDFVEDMKLGAGPKRQAVTSRTLTTAGAVGVAAGTLGTWFETSHGIFCIPVLTLPPLTLSHQAQRHPVEKDQDQRSNETPGPMGRTAAIPLSAWGPPGPALLDAMGREHSARDLAEQLREFRERYPIDERASDFLEKVDSEVLATVLAEFRPKRAWSQHLGQQRNGRHPPSSSSEPSEPREKRRERRRRRYESSESSQETADHRAMTDSFGRTRKDASPKERTRARRTAASSSSSPRVKPQVKVNASDNESGGPSSSLQELQAAVQAAQERVNRVEADARDEERLKNSKAEDDARAMVNLVGGDVLAKPRVEEAVNIARERAQREMEFQLAEAERRLRMEMDQSIDDERQAAEEAGRARKMELEREARQERVILAQKKADKAHKKAIAKAKQMLSSSASEPRRPKEKKDGRESEWSREKRPPGARSGAEGPTQRELDDFRDRYPIDSRAYGVLTSPPLLLGEDDYSALVASFVRAVMHRHSQAVLAPRAANNLSEFRARYPMDDRAFGVLERTSSGVQSTVLADFRPRREGEDDYSALVMGFIRSIEARTGTGLPRDRGSRGYRREDVLRLQLGPKSITLRVRVLWIRHGLSCANVLNACAAGGNQALLPQLEVALFCPS